MNRSMLIEFADAHTLHRAVQKLREKHWTIEESYSPVPIDDGVQAASVLRPRSLPIVALAAGVLSGVGCYAMEYYSAVIDYPIDVGGRPMHSAIAFIPAALECALLGAALGIIVSFLVNARLPRFHHPLFDIEEFAQVTDNRFFLRVRRPTEIKLDDIHPLMKELHVIAVDEVRGDV